jgi:hypothetical protein
VNKLEEIMIKQNTLHQSSSIKVNNQKFFITASASALGLVSIYLLYLNKNSLRSKLINLCRTPFNYFTNPSMSDDNHHSSATNAIDTTTLNTNRTPPNPEFVKKREHFANLNSTKKFGDTTLPSSSSPKNSENPKFRKNELSKDVMQTGDDFRASTRSSIMLSPLDVEINRNVAKLKQNIDHWSRKDPLTFEPNADCQIDLFKLIEFMLENFAQIDPNKRIEISTYFERLSEFNFFQQSDSINCISFLNVLNSLYSSSRNKDLFENYVYNNTNGELATDVVELLLKVSLNMTKSSGENLKEMLDSELINEILLKLLHSYIVDLEKNRNNVKRTKRVESIKLTSLRILGNILDFFHKHISDEENGEELIRRNASAFVMAFLHMEPIFLPNEAKFGQGRRQFSSSFHLNSLSSSRESLSSKQQYHELMLHEYIRFVNSFLKLFVEILNDERFADLNAAIGDSGESRTFYGYLIGSRFFDGVQSCFQISNKIDEMVAFIIKSLFRVKEELVERDLEMLETKFKNTKSKNDEIDQISTTTESL